MTANREKMNSKNEKKRNNKHEGGISALVF